MKCPYCSTNNTKVTDTRELNTADIIRRRRECIICHKRFTTHEKVEKIEFIVLKKNNEQEPFSKNKLKSGIIKACEKRPISDKDINKIVNEIECNLLNSETPVVNSKLIGKLVMDKLNKLDKIAYLRFASVYKEFNNINSFKEEINKLKISSRSK